MGSNCGFFCKNKSVMLIIPIGTIFCINLLIKNVISKETLKNPEKILKMVAAFKNDDNPMEQVSTVNNQTQANRTREMSKSGYRIMGGQEMPRHGIPWQVAMVWMDDTAILCGGTIICPKFVMTSAHCTKGNEPDYIQIIAGAHGLSNLTGNEIEQSRHNVAKIHNHPNYTEVMIENCEGNCKYPDYDYSILELSDPIKFTPAAKPVFLPQKGETNFNGPNTEF